MYLLHITDVRGTINVYFISRDHRIDRRKESFDTLSCLGRVDVQRLCQGNGPAIMSVVAVSSQ